MMHGQKTSK